SRARWASPAGTGLASAAAFFSGGFFALGSAFFGVSFVSLEPNQPPNQLLGVLVGASPASSPAKATVTPRPTTRATSNPQVASLRMVSPRPVWCPAPALGGAAAGVAVESARRDGLCHKRSALSRPIP